MGYVVSRGVAGVCALALTAGVVAGCSSSGDQVPSIGYTFDNVLTTYNARTVDGAASGARQAFSRVQTGFSYLGPEGEALSDNDIGTAQAVPGDVQTIRYTFAPAAKYSDGISMACDDLVLAWAANSGRFTDPDTDAPLFDAASTSGYSDIERIDCAPGAKDATVVFAPGRAYQDWRSLFRATDLLPAHVAARVLGLSDVVTPVLSQDRATVGRIAQFWNTGWSLGPGALDLSLFPSAGPYRVDSFSAEEGLVLVANESWWGNVPQTQRIVLWPKGSDIESKVASGDIEVMDEGAGSFAAGVGDGLSITALPSRGVEQLTMATAGVLGDAAARRRLASCVPRSALFDAHGHPGYDDAAGLGSGVTQSRLVQADTLIYPPVAATSGDRYLQPETQATGAPVTVRVGYLGPDVRRAAVVAQIAQACAATGITVVDASTNTFLPSALRAGTVDVVLGSAASMQGASGSAAETSVRNSLRSGAGTNYGGYSNSRIDAIVDAMAVETSEADLLALATEGETILWNEMPTLPLYNQPRSTTVADGMQDVVPNPTAAGAGWNMDRWILVR